MLVNKEIYVVSHRGMNELEEPKVFLEKKQAKQYITDQLAELVVDSCEDDLDEAGINKEDHDEVCRWASDHDILDGDSFVMYSDWVEFRLDKVTVGFPEEAFDPLASEIKIIA